MAFEIAVVSCIYAIGGILLGHFEEQTPKIRRLGKFFLTTALAVLISRQFGILWFWLFLAVLIAGGLMIHLWWLPKNGVNGWTGEPKEKYYELRGWQKSKNA